LKPSYTAYDPVSRSYFVTTQRNNSAASLWGLTLAKDVGSSTPIGPEVRYHYPELDMPLMGLQVWHNGQNLEVLAFFQNCTVLLVDYTSGHSSKFADVCNSTRAISTAIDINQDENVVYVITQAAQGDPNREVVTLNLQTRKCSSVPLAPLKNHNAAMEMAFEAVWVASLKSMVVFYTGLFDQLIYTSPVDGSTSFAIFDLAEYNGPTGSLEFTEDDRLEADDLWGDAVINPQSGKIWFQCSDVEDGSGMATTTLCQIQMPDTIKQLNYVNIAIWPMTYGYVGMQFVSVVQ
jgi:hypothetical protein